MSLYQAACIRIHVRQRASRFFIFLKGRSMTSTVPDVAQDVSRVTEPSYNRDTSAVTTSDVTSYISDQSFISSVTAVQLQLCSYIRPHVLRRLEMTRTLWPIHSTSGIGTSVSTGPATLRKP